MSGSTGSGIRLPRRGTGQSTDQYLDVLVRQIELALQQLGQKQGRPPAVSGSRGGNAALASLLTALAAAGDVSDQTTS